MARYILKDYASVEYEYEEPRVYTFKNKDEVIAQLLSFLGEDMHYEVKK
jgi:hypothetical protein